MRLSALIVDWGGVLDDPDGRGAGDRTGVEAGAEMSVLEAVRGLRRNGAAVALVSNSASREGLPTADFDVVAVSGELGAAKPSERIYRYTAEALGRRPEECVFVDDLRSNVDAAVALGMVGVHHVAADRTVLELEALFGAPATERGPLAPPQQST
ncbi:HAD-IA family hydrolase [Bounagaea algeriensis]